MGIKIGIGGKGGVGKTTICALWAQLFAQDGFDVLAIDADPNTTLASAFGIPSSQSPEPLINMKELIAERTGARKDAVGAYFKLNPEVGDLPDKYCLEVKGVKLLALGAITQAGAGCACPEGAFLKAMLTHTILHRQEVVLVDLAAGVESMGRASVQGLDVLIVVVEPGARSIDTALNITKMAKELGIKNIAAIANKIAETRQIETIRDGLTNIAILANIRYNSSLQEADLRKSNVFEADKQVVEQLKAAKNQLMNIVSEKTKTEI